ncbi:glycosyltransferase [Rathayibacter sp. CAU 1779]
MATSPGTTKACQKAQQQLTATDLCEDSHEPDTSILCSSILCSFVRPRGPMRGQGGGCRRHDRFGRLMHVMFVAQCVYGGGAEVVVSRWSNQLVEMGHKVDLVTTNPDLDDIELDSRVGRYRMRHLPPLRKAVGLRRLVLKRRPDVVMSHLTRQNVILLASLLGVSRSRRPVVAITEHSVLSLISGTTWTGRAGRTLARALYPHADLAFCVSHAAAADLLRYGVAGDTLRVVANPLFDHPIPMRSRPSVFSPGSHTIRLISPMRLAEQKQPVRAIETVCELRRRGYNAELISFGAGPMLTEMQDTARRLKVPVDFRGWDPAWTDSCDADDIVLLPSKVEGLGNVLVEAAAAGLRSVAPSTALGVSDALLPGITGELACTSSACDLADAVERVRTVRLELPVEWLERFRTDSSANALLAALQSRMPASAAPSPDAKASSCVDG